MSPLSDHTATTDSFQARVRAAQELEDAVRSTGQDLTITSLGYIRIFHATSTRNMESIMSSGQLIGNTWLAASSEEAKRHAKLKHGRSTVSLAILIDPRDIEFSTGTGEFYAPDGLVRDDGGIWHAA